MSGTSNHSAQSTSQTIKDDPVTASLRIIGESMGFEVVGSDGNDDLETHIRIIARSSGFRTRKVTLKGEWWKHDGGTFLGFLGEDKLPVALIERKGTRYTMRNPSDGTSQNVTRELAGTLFQTAYMIIPVMGREKLTASEIIKYTFASSRRDIILLIIAAIVVALLGLVNPIFSKILLDDIIPGANRPRLLEYGLMMGLLILIMGLFQLVRSFALLRLDGYAEVRLQSAIMDRVLRLPTTFFRNYLSGDLANRVLGISEIREMLTSVTMNAILTGVFAFINILYLYYYDLTLAVIGTLLAAMAFAILYILSVAGVRVNRKLSDQQGRISGLLFQLLSGIAKIRVAGAEGRAYGNWAEQFNEQNRLSYRSGLLMNRFLFFQAGFPLLSFIVFFGVTVYLLNELTVAGTRIAVSTGSFASVLLAFQQFLLGIFALGIALFSVTQVIPKYERSRPVFEAELEAGGAAKSPGKLTGAIEIRNISFSYPGNTGKVLDGVSMSIEPGQMVAIVGPSGAGKSTLVRLLLGFERPESGAVLFNGQDASGLDMESVRHQIGVVLQNDVPVPGNIYENIVGESSTLTMEDAWEAARKAGLEEDIKAMGMQMFTVVNEGGSAFSGGQIQRLMIARAIVQKPSILLFDEATSALDNRTQQIVSKSLEALNVTRVIIAHRLSTIREADKIYVLQDGKIVESGTYAELMKQNGEFARLAKRQLIENPDVG